ncbi:MAG: bifunctional phosphoribosylaminoimidazolecarboxamide formyltransferase/IMP cyclohydrolase [Candidatus Altiarchaeota archaeon]
MKAKTALISVSDKRGLAEFASGLSSLGVTIISTGGTAKLLKEKGIPFTHISDYTGTPEMLDGRVKTIHFKIHGGLLARRDKKEHMSQIEEYGMDLIDLVVVNLYPFKQTISKKDVSLEDAIENIDVGGPTLIRAAAKNYQHVGAVIDPSDYEPVLTELRENDLSLSEGTLARLAVKAFQHTAEYDSLIYDYLSRTVVEHVKFPDTVNLSLTKLYDLRYGENSHQAAAFYADPSYVGSCVGGAKLLAGDKKLSFNNILDLDAALRLVVEFDKPAAVIVKHLNPSGVGVADSLGEAYSLAHKADPLSAFGCIVALNRPVDEKLAEEITSTFVESVIAPGYEASSLDILKKKEKMRVLDIGSPEKPKQSFDYRRVVGGMLVQDMDLRELTRDDLKTVSNRKPSEEEVEAMLFAWKVCRHTKSNSIIFAKKGYTTGIGAGQMSRVDAVKIAAMKAGEHANGSVMASDAFFPFRDGIDEAAKAGVSAVIHPGGSIRDAEVIQAADEHGMAMVYTGVRCFLH